MHHASILEDQDSFVGWRLGSFQVSSPSCQTYRRACVQSLPKAPGSLALSKTQILARSLMNYSSLLLLFLIIQVCFCWSQLSTNLLLARAYFDEKSAFVLEKLAQLERGLERALFLARFCLVKIMLLGLAVAESFLSIVQGVFLGHLAFVACLVKDTLSIPAPSIDPYFASAALSLEDSLKGPALPKTVNFSCSQGSLSLEIDRYSALVDSLGYWLVAVLAALLLAVNLAVTLRVLICSDAAAERKKAALSSYFSSRTGPSQRLRRFFSFISHGPMWWSILSGTLGLSFSSLRSFIFSRLCRSLSDAFAALSAQVETYVRENLTAALESSVHSTLALLDGLVSALSALRLPFSLPALNFHIPFTGCQLGSLDAILPEFALPAFLSPEALLKLFFDDRGALFGVGLGDLNASPFIASALSLSPFDDPVWLFSLVVLVLGLLLLLQGLFILVEADT